jgi:hypothetical protein
MALSAAYKQLNAPFGQFGLSALHYDTAAVAGSDTTFAAADDQLAACAQQRNALVPQIKAVLQGAETGGQAINPATAHALTAQAQTLIGDMQSLQAAGPGVAPTVCGSSSTVSGTVPATLSLSLGAPATFGAFTPGVTNDYSASTTASVISSAGDGALSVSDPSTTAPGHLVNGTFALPSALQAQASSPGGTGTGTQTVGAAPATLLTYAGPVANDPVSLVFKQHIDRLDPLRTGTYAKTLTFTLSTTQP